MSFFLQPIKNPHDTAWPGKSILDRYLSFMIDKVKEGSPWYRNNLLPSYIPLCIAPQIGPFIISIERLSRVHMVDLRLDLPYQS